MGRQTLKQMDIQIPNKSNAHPLRFIITAESNLQPLYFICAQQKPFHFSIAIYEKDDKNDFCVH